MAKPTAQLRQDYLADRLVLVAPQRLKRPQEQEVNYAPEPVRGSVREADCPFCSPNIKRSKPLLVAGKGAGRITVIKNKYPAVTLQNRRAYGVQEVVVETPHHDLQLEDLPVGQVERLLEVYAARTRTLIKNRKLEYVLIFKNNGGQAGASLRHAHSQIFATGFVPPHLVDKSHRLQAYHLKTGHCLYCDVIRKERAGPRLVYEDKVVVAFTPNASLYSYELWIFTKRHLDNITALDPGERASMARVLHRAVGKVTRGLRWSYNYYFHQVVRDEDQHFYLKLAPRGVPWGGVELGTSIVVNPVSPEQAARFYKK